MPSGALTHAPHPAHTHSADSAPWHAGQASNSRNRLTSSEDRVDERRERLDSGRENQHETKYAEKHRKRQQPALSRLAAPQAACEVGDRSAGTGDHDQPTLDAATLLEDHAPDSLKDVAGVPARLTSTARPATSTSMPHRRNVV